MPNQYFVYIMASKKNGTLYIGMTGDLEKRLYEHKNNLTDGFTKKYSVHSLVYFEETTDAYEALNRERQLKKWNRQWKIELIEKATLVGTICQRCLFEKMDSHLRGNGKKNI